DSLGRVTNRPPKPVTAAFRSLPAVSSWCHRQGRSPAPTTVAPVGDSQMGVPGMSAIRIGIGAALTIIALVSSGVPASAVSAGDPRPTAAQPILYSRAEPIVYSATMPDFVTRSGANLLLNGRPYRFAGLNIYNANNQGQCWYQLGTTVS